MRVLIDYEPFVINTTSRPWNHHGRWPCSWIGCANAGSPPFVTAYRLQFTLDAAATVRAHVTADERYELFLDGSRVGRGSERGDPDLWFYETYDLVMDAGPHVLVARVWALGAVGPFAQMSTTPGFIFAPEGAFTTKLGTGHAAWEARRLEGYEFLSPGEAWGTGAKVKIDGRAFAWNVERGDGDSWQPAEILAPGLGSIVDYEWPIGHLLRPATLPPMIEQELSVGRVRHVSEPPSQESYAIPIRAADHRAVESPAWDTLVAGQGAVTVAPHTRRRVLIDLENYYCAYPQIVTSRGAGSTLRLHWEEALCHAPDVKCQNKGNRDQIEGKYFIGVGDTFVVDGGIRRHFETLWWEAGRYLELLVETGEEELTINQLQLRETRYPLELESTFEADDTRLARVIPIMVRGMQMCSHETYMDCPYFEQLMYAGDTRLEVLTTYIMTNDDRLPRKALRLFDASRLASGLTQSRYPSRVRQVIAPFALWWIGMVYDHAFWRDNPELIAGLLPGVRATIEGFGRFRKSDGLIHVPDGWNFMDWVPAWEGGIPPGGVSGASGLINWQFVLVLGLVAELERNFGDAEAAARMERQAHELAETCIRLFWDEGRGCLADDLSQEHFSEHTQCLAILSGRLDAARQEQVAAALLRESDLARTTIYFTHYLFETLRVLNRTDVLVERMSLWFDLEQSGFKTTVEMPEPSRSDCHAWGAHPLFHYFASILGIQPASPGFRTVSIRPQLGPLANARGRLVHPRGEILADLRVDDGVLHGTIALPEAVTGTLYANGAEIELHDGSQEI